jgi:hypothetical protein
LTGSPRRTTDQGFFELSIRAESVLSSRNFFLCIKPHLPFPPADTHQFDPALAKRPGWTRPALLAALAIVHLVLLHYLSSSRPEQGAKGPTVVWATAVPAAAPPPLPQTRSARPQAARPAPAVAAPRVATPVSIDVDRQQLETARQADLPRVGASTVEGIENGQGQAEAADAEAARAKAEAQAMIAQTVKQAGKADKAVRKDLNPWQQPPPLHEPRIAGAIADAYVGGPLMRLDTVTGADGRSIARITSRGRTVCVVSDPSGLSRARDFGATPKNVGVRCPEWGRK